MSRTSCDVIFNGRYDEPVYLQFMAQYLEDRSSIASQYQWIKLEDEKTFLARPMSLSSRDHRIKIPDTPYAISKILNVADCRTI
jgi:hypothetical protein